MITGFVYVVETGSLHRIRSVFFDVSSAFLFCLSPLPVYVDRFLMRNYESPAGNFLETPSFDWKFLLRVKNIESI
jgi:hypothetical protein